MCKVNLLFRNLDLVLRVAEVVRPARTCVVAWLKLLRSKESVQLIVFFAAISEILKKEIYGRDKPRLLPIENKGRMGMQLVVAKRISNPAHSLSK